LENRKVWQLPTKPVYSRCAEAVSGSNSEASERFKIFQMTQAFVGYISIADGQIVEPGQTGKMSQCIIIKIGAADIETSKFSQFGYVSHTCISEFVRV